MLGCYELGGVGGGLGAGSDEGYVEFLFGTGGGLGEAVLFVVEEDLVLLHIIILVWEFTI